MCVREEKKIYVLGDDFCWSGDTDGVFLERRDKLPPLCCAVPVQDLPESGLLGINEPPLPQISHSLHTERTVLVKSW